ncbi:serine-rich adhesin for platelets-like isoform X2 [Haliotis cracherodii]|uniref:serine-rich adhesin for platelets-like isoform X2 n=1 Tax=Haliotis cracherodii TaxID=6455 RepID=UPI0039EB8EFB
MEANTLYILLAVTSLGHASRLIPMCTDQETNSSQTPVILYMDEGAKFTAPLCSCKLQSQEDFYVTLKRFKPTNENLGPGSVSIGVTYDMTKNNTPAIISYGLDLPTMQNNLTGSDCLIHSGNSSQSIIPQHCWKNTTERTITLEAFHNLTQNGHLYLSVFGAGTMIAAIIMLCLAFVVLGAAVVTFWLIYRKKQLSKKRRKRDRLKASTHMDWTPETVTYEDMDEDLCKKEKSQTTTENVLKLETETYALARDTGLDPSTMVSVQDKSQYDVAHVSVSKVVAPSGDVDEKDDTYDVAACCTNRQQSHLPSDDLYGTAATADSHADVSVNHPGHGDEQSLTAAVTSSTSTREGVRSVEQISSDEELKTPLDETTSHSLSLVRQKSVEVISLESCDTGPEDGVDSHDVDMHVSQFVNSVYNSETEVSEEEFENVPSPKYGQESDDEEIYVNQIEIKGSYSSDNKGKPLEEYTNLSPTRADNQSTGLPSLKTRADNQGTRLPSSKTTADNQRLSLPPSKTRADNQRKSVSPSRTRPDNHLGSSPVISNVPFRPVLHSVSSAASTVDDKEIYQNVTSERTNSTASLLTISSGSDKPYENLIGGRPYEPDPETPACPPHNESNSSAVVVVFLPGQDSNPAEEDEPEPMSKTSQPKVGHKHSFSVDESSKIPRPLKRKNRTRSDDTDLLIHPSSSSEEDVLVMVNNNLYEDINKGQLATSNKKPAAQKVIAKTIPDDLQGRVKAQTTLKQQPGAVATSSSHRHLDDELVMMENDTYESLKGCVSIFPSSVASQIRKKVEHDNPKSPLDKNEFFSNERL